MRLEGYRKYYQIDTGSMIRHFKSLLSNMDKGALDQMMDQQAWSMGTNPTLTWASVVNYATFRTSHPRLRKQGPHPIIDPVPL